MVALLALFLELSPHYLSRLFLWRSLHPLWLGSVVLHRVLLRRRLHIVRRGQVLAAVDGGDGARRHIVCRRLIVDGRAADDDADVDIDRCEVVTAPADVRLDGRSDSLKRVR